MIFLSVCLPGCLWARAASEPIRTSITITETITAEAPASVTVFERQGLQQLPGVNADDRFRMVPGFSLLRRSSSIAANPTTQGVSLRGIGPSGASRTLVLRDGIPMNSPFGGWVYWTRLDPAELERAEVSRGASTSLFGDRAMGGAVALFTHSPSTNRLFAGFEGGNKSSHQLSAGYAGQWSRWSMSLNGRGYRTDGYYIVPSSIQGSVDTPAGVDFAAGEARLDWTGSRDRLAFRFDALAEDRANGTVLQRNSSSVGLVSGAYSREMGRDMFSLLGYHSREIFRSSFTAIAADRQSERLTSLQRVPSEATGAAGYWRRASRVWNLLAGGDTQRVEGYSTDRYVPAGIATGGGVIHQTGGFLQTDFRAGPLKLFLGGRAHHAGAQGNYFSPSAGLAAGKGQWRVRGSVYRAFRAPTLNELYRDFRAGNAVTRANASLTPELLFGAEAGMDFVGESIRGSITLFRNSLGDLITNVTLSSTPAEVVRQRRNAGEGFSRGVEVELRRKFALVRVEGSYLYSDSRFASGLRIPQVPLHQGAAQLIMPWRGTLFAAGIRSTSLQFEDDLNRDVLPGYAVLHLTVGHRLPHGLALHLAVENLLNREYLAGKRPAPLLAAPLLWRVGLRWDGKPP